MTAIREEGSKMDSTMALMCVECEDTEANIKCENCNDVYCTLCYQAQHHAGTRLQHKQIPLGEDGSSSTTISPPPAPSTTAAPGTTGAISSSSLIQKERNSPPSKTQKTSFDSSPTRFEIDSKTTTTTTTTSSTTDSTRDGQEVNPDEQEEDEEHDKELEEYMDGYENSKANAVMLQEAAYIPLRLSEEERHLFTLLDASLNVSEYTDKVDVFSYRSTASRIVKELIEVFSTLSGMLVASDFRQGKKLVQDKKFEENQEFFQQIFEIGRRYKIMNPERMRDNYGKMIYLLQDANLREIREHMSFSCVKSIQTVFGFLKQRHALDLLKDPLLCQATGVYLVSDSENTSDSNKVPVSRELFLQQKQEAIESIVSQYVSSSISRQEIELCLASIADSNSYLVTNRRPIDKMIFYLEHFFHPTKMEPGFSLEIRAGRNGARLNHSHASQYEYVLQSFLLWRNITTKMLRLWWAVEDDLILSGNMYRLRDTGQGLNRMQHAPKTSHLIHTILTQTQKSRNGGWVGSSTIHLGDHNVPNALMFIDKYTQLSRILSPIVQTIEEIDVLEQKEETRRYIVDTFENGFQLKKTILCDFFKHGFDGSGADNFFDAGSCIDGRLTSAWNWCSKIEKKDFFHVFLMAGFVGFDGHFEK